ncbi:hypothetical protein [Rhodococcus sp. LB1]|nr:hypothetical protein [Rhodococcus sp. LB1]
MSERNVADVERELAMLAYVRDRLRVSEGHRLTDPDHRRRPGSR